MQHEIAILTPEKVAISYRIARAGSRIGAFLIDIVVIMGIVYLLNQLSAVIATSARGGGNLIVAGMSVLMFFSFFLYFALFEGFWNGQTIGKKALSIRTRMADGTPVTFPAALYRALLLPADFLPSLFLIGLALMFLTEKSQRLGDLVANTMVTHEKIAVPQFGSSPHKLGTHPFEDSVGELRGMRIEEYHAIKRLCDRFPELPAPTQAKLMAEIWAPFQDRMGIQSIANVHDVYLMEAVVMKFGRKQGLV